MAVTLCTLTFRVADLIGASFNPRRTRVWIETNVPGDVIIDAAGNSLYLGNGLPDTQADGYIAANGVGQFTGLIATNSTTNPTAWQYQVWVEYDRHLPQQTAGGAKSRWSSGWFSLTASADLADVVAEQYVPPTWMTTATATLQGYVDQGKAYRDDQALIAGLTGEDTAVAALIDQAGPTPAESAVHAALSASTEAKVSTDTADVDSLIGAALDKRFRVQTMNLRDVVTPSGTNDTAAVNSALATFAAAGGGKLVIPRDDWTFTGATGLTLTSTAAPIHVEAEPGTEFDMTGVSASVAMKLGGSATATSAALGADVSKGADTITCATVAAAVVAGDIIQISSTDLFETLQNLVKGEFAEVLSVSGSTITLKSGLWDSYTASTTTVTLLQMPRVSVENLNLLGNANTTGLQVMYARDALLGGLRAEGFRITLMQLDRVFGATADNLAGRDFWYSGTSNSYGLVVSASQHIREIGLDLRGGRHAISHGGSLPTRDVTTIGGTFDSHHAAAQPAFDYHGNCEAVSILGATILNGLLVQASNAHVGGGTRIRGHNRSAVEIGPARSCDYVKIENADIESAAGFDGITYTPRNGANVTTLGLLKIDVTVRAGATGVRLTPAGASSTGATIDRLVVRGDIAAGGASSAVDIGKSTAAYVGINTSAEFVGRFYAPASYTLALSGTSSARAKFGGEFTTGGSGYGPILCQMFGDVVVAPEALLKGTNSPYRSTFANAGVLDMDCVTIDGASSVGGINAGTGPTEARISNVRRVNTTGTPSFPARTYSRINSSGKVTTSGTAAPAAGAWNVGDRCENTTPAVGSAKAWVCTVAGSPGTWVSEGNL